MLQEERLSIITEQVNRRGAVKISDLVERLEASESTIRRDIVQLDKIGKVRRVFGGAVALDTSLDTFEEDISFKSTVHTEAKEEIGRYAASLIKDDDVVFIDAGSTTEKMIDHMDNSNAVYFTNGVFHSQKLAQKGFHVELIGGRVRPLTMSVVGAQAAKTIGRLNFTKAFLGVNGIHGTKGYTTPDVEEATIKRTALERAFMTFVLADSSKFGRVSMATFGELEDCLIITDKLGDFDFDEITVVKEVGKE